MVKKKGSFTAKEMFDSLKSHQRTASSFVASVKPHSKNSEMLMVSPVGGSGEWTEIHESAIEEFGIISPAADENAGHVVRLQLREAADESEPDLHSALLNVADEAALGAKAGPSGFQYCYYDAQGRYVCVPV